MTPKSLAEAVRAAEAFIALARAFDRTYPTYPDGKGQEHYVVGPGTRQIRDAMAELQWAIRDVRYITSTALPPIDLTAPAKPVKGG